MKNLLYRLDRIFAIVIALIFVVPWLFVKLLFLLYKGLTTEIADFVCYLRSEVRALIKGLE